MAPDSLAQYQSMRDFSATPEPKGKVRTTKGATYIVQKHDATRLHWDFRLELDGVLLSWAVTRGPSLNPKDKRLAVRTEDHPVDYAGFEGVIPSGYGAGTVMLWDRGQWAPQEDPHEGLKKGSLKIVLNGERLKGGFALVRLKPKPGEKRGRENWLLIKERDDWADETFVATDEWIDSVKTGLDFKGIEKDGERYKRGKAYKPGAKTTNKAVKKTLAKKVPSKRSVAKAKPRAKAKKARQTAALKSRKADRLDGPRSVPKFVAPELATLVEAPPAGAEWVHEIKFDGYRILAVVKKNKVQLWTRNALNWTHKYASIAKALEAMKLGDCTLDGELVALGDNGQGEFSLMQGAAENDKAKLVYYVFDLLNEQGQDVRKRSLHDRKERLKALVDGAPQTIRYSEHIDGSGVEVIASACGLKLEGVISKRRDAPYTSGRGRDWVKSKCLGNDEFVIVGYRRSDKRGRPFASLLLGEHVDGELVYRGRVGTGFDDAVFGQLSSKFRSRERKTSALAEIPVEAKRGAVWLTPDLVAQIAYAEQTPDGRLRHPSYLGLREDKEAAEVTSATRTGKIRGAAAKKAAPNKVAKKAAKKAPVKRAKAAGGDDPQSIDGVRLTSPDKVLWPDVGVTKLMLAEYYARMATYILPFVKDRPLSLVRCPEGIAGECFFQKHHVMSTPDEISTVPIEEKDGETKDYLVIHDARGLVAAAQIGGLELHVWGVRTDMIEKPERVIFDLDPDEALSFVDVKAAAFEIRDLLEAAGLKSFPLLTGGKGVHVIAPLGRRNDWSEVKAFARGFATRVAAAAPDRYVAGASKAKRKGRIFIDWLRNERGATAVAPFSVRARKGAPVAAPVSWKELERIDSAATWTIETIQGRLSVLKSDPWRGYAATRQSVSAGLREMFS